jgi:protein TonB
MLPLLLAVILSLFAPAPQQGTSDPNPDAEGIYHFAQDVTIPKLAYSVEPEFSEKANRRKLAGNVSLKFIVDVDGAVHPIAVTRSAAEQYASKKDREAAATLDLKAIEAVQRYRFEPAQFHGKPVPCWMTIEVNFQRF